jgi:hypothetical protein
VANRDNHYEAAFEAYLRSRGVPYVAELLRSITIDAAGGRLTPPLASVIGT